MKKFLIILFLIALVSTTIYFQNDIVNYILNIINNYEVLESTVIESNNYKSNFSYQYIENTYSSDPNSIEDLKKIYYSFINSGMDEITVYCNNEYKTCIDDASRISGDNVFLNALNNYVHPYNSYSYIETKIYGNNKIVISLIHNYTPQMIDEINNKVDEIINDNINDYMSITEKIKTIHDYIINTTKYDSLKNNDSSSAYKALFNGISTCNGYTDLMSIFLYKLNIPNYKISSENHIWNYVKIDDKWYHLDLTWDDPVTTSGIDLLLYDYFLISSDKLNNLDKTEHTYNNDLFPETKN